MVQSVLSVCQHSMLQPIARGLSAQYGTVHSLDLSAQYIQFILLTCQHSMVKYITWACRHSVAQSIPWACPHSKGFSPLSRLVSTVWWSPLHWTCPHSMVQSSPLACQHSKGLVHFLGLSALYGTVLSVGLSAQ